MSIRVISGKVFDGENTYEVGEIIYNLEKHEENRLISAGVGEYVDATEGDSAKNDNKADGAVNESSENTGDEVKKDDFESYGAGSGLNLNIDGFFNQSS